MAPTSPSKRSTPSDSEDGPVEEPTSKRRRGENDLPVTPPPEDEVKVNKPKVTTFEDDPHQLLERSIALALQHVGFHAASKEAMQAFCSEVETCQFFTLYKLLILINSRCRALPVKDRVLDA
jgi:transcription initiation factor TFIID subunit 8